MKKLLIVPVVVAMVAGCVIPQKMVSRDNLTSKRAAVVKQLLAKELDKPTLYELTDAHETRRPEKYGFYTNDSWRIKIFQVCFEVDEKTKEEMHYVLARGEDLVVAVFSDREYVEDEYLVPGEYCYCGPYQYQTAPVVRGVQTTGTKTVRLFVEVTTDEIRKRIESRKRELAEQSLGRPAR